MRNQVLQFLRNLPNKKEDQFNQAFLFLQKAPGVQFAQVRSYNVLGATQNNINNILYDLKKLYGITEVEIRSKKATLIDAIETQIDKVLEETDKIANEVLNITSNSEESTQKNSLHDIFPFLKDKSCPNELLIVSGQVVASWKRYQEFKKEVDAISEGTLEVSEEENLRITAECQAEFAANQALYKELEYYKENNKILGEHEVLKEYAMQKEVDKMTPEQLVKFRTNAASNKSKGKTKLEKAKDEATAEKIKQRMANTELKLALVNKKLGMNG